MILKINFIFMKLKNRCWYESQIYSLLPLCESMNEFEYHYWLENIVFMSDLNLLKFYILLKRERDLIQKIVEDFQKKRVLEGLFYKL